MRIPFPERVSLFYASVFGAFLCLMLIASGSGTSFSVLAFVFVVVSTVAFNTAGGLTRPSGSYVFFFAMLVVIVGLVVKVILWEPAETFLHSPVTTMGAYTGGMAAMLAAAYTSRKLSRKDGFLQDICSTEDMGLAAVGCIVGGFGIPFFLGLGVEFDRSLFLPILTAVLQLNRFLNMAIILGTTYAIKKSGGKRSINGSVIFGTLLIFYSGVLIGFSKEALFTPPLCWLASCGALRYRFSLYQLVSVALVLVFSGFYLVPYCQYGRNLSGESDTIRERLTTSFGLLTHLEDVRAKYRASSAAEERSAKGWWFFQKDVGLFDRLTMFGIDDALVTATDQKGPIGMSLYSSYVAMIVPRVLWKNKPQSNVGNTFARELGFDENDTTTGISFTPVAEAYHEATWFGVLVVEPIVWILLFVVMDSLCGDVRKSPWGILVLALFAHIAPEGGLQGAFYMMTYGAFIVLFVAYFSAYLMPLLASLVSPPKRNVVPLGTGRGGGGAAFVNGQPAPLKR